MRASLSCLLEEVSRLPRLQQRKVGCLVGAAVGDAAARPLHWVYDIAALNSAVKTNPNQPEFWPRSYSPFYSLETGDTSCYWDQAMAVLTAITDQEFSYQNICQELVQQLGPGSAYNMEARQEFMWRRSQGLSLTPVKGKWLHGGMIKFLENFSQGSRICGDPSIKETDGFCCSLPVAVRFAGQPRLVEAVLRVASTQSTWPVAVRHAVVAARIVEAFILEREEPILSLAREIEPEFPEISREMEQVVASKTVDHTTAVGQIFGRPCYNPGSFLGALHAVLSSHSFPEAVRKTILAGGCNCSRAFFIGQLRLQRGKYFVSNDINLNQVRCLVLNMEWRAFLSIGWRKLKISIIFLN